MVLSALELLHERLTSEQDLTLEPIIREAAGTVFFPRYSANDSLISLIDRVLASGDDNAATAARAQVEAGVLLRTVAEPEVLTRFADVLLHRLKAALEAPAPEAAAEDVLLRRNHR